MRLGGRLGRRLGQVVAALDRDGLARERHRSAQRVLGYLTPAEQWRNNVTEGVFQVQPRESDDDTK